MSREVFEGFTFGQSRQLIGVFGHEETHGIGINPRVLT